MRIGRRRRRTPSAPAAAVDDTQRERIADDRPQPTPLWALLSRWLLALEAWLRSHGGTGLQYGIRAFWAFIAAAGILLMFGPVINKPLTLDDITSSASTATERWIAREFAVDYRITRDDDGALEAHVEERIGAFFPAEVDEQGIERVLAVEYQGHALDPSGIRATVDGKPVDIARSATADRLTLTLDAGQRLAGDHEFVLEYTLHDLAYQTTDSATGAAVDLLEWDVFGPSWPQGVAAIDVAVTLPDDLDAGLARPPRGSVAWTLVSAGDWLEPEPDSAPGDVTYAFTNEQNLPPHAQAWFTMAFAPGTFVMPAPTPLFLLQTFGPLLPLALLAVTLLLALAARAVAWSDERGRPWIVAQFDPPKGVSARLAAQVLRTRWTAELAGALAAAQDGGSGGRRDRMIAAARVARRTGRVGDRARALSRYLAAPERREQLRKGLRRIPRGFVRDLFIAAPLALTLVQWGIVRQLSYQAALAVVWWPVAFVLVSSVISAVVLSIALTARPLTREGALVAQHLRGIELYADRTGLLERTTAKERLLPYAVLTAPPRTAGRRVTEVLAHELGDPDAGRGWQTPGFMTWPALLVRTLSIVIVAGAIALVAFIPNPYEGTPDYATHYGDVPGTLYTEFDSIDISAVLARTPDGQARLAVSEKIHVTIDEGSGRVPQIAQQWRNRAGGHDLRVVVDRVLVDGVEVRFVTEPDADTLLMRTTMNDVLVGEHDVRIDYTLQSAAFVAEADGVLVDRVRWAALLENWDYFSSWADEPVDPQRIEIRLSDDLAALASDAGWISEDTDSAESARGWEETVIPFGTLSDALAPPGDEEPDPAHVTTESLRSESGAEVYALELRSDQYDSYPFDLTVGDTGISLDFPAGTFAGLDEQELRTAQFLGALPDLATLTTGLLALLLGLVGMALRAMRPGTVETPGTPRDLVRWIGSAAAVATCILFVWVTVEMPADDSAFALYALAALAAIAGGVMAWVATRRRKIAGPTAS